MTNEAAETVHEEPATHKKKSQLWVVLCIAALCAVLIIDVVMKQLDKPATPMFQESTDTTSEPVPVAPTFDPKAFQERVARSQVALEQQRQKDAQGVAQDPLQRMAELRAQQEIAQTKQNQQLFGTGGGGVASNFSNQNGGMSDEDSWANEERQRVRSARKSGFGFSLPEATNQNFGTGIAQRKSANAGINTGTNITTQQTQIQQELDRVNKMIESQLAGQGMEISSMNVTGAEGLNVPQIPFAERYSKSSSEFNVGEPVVNNGGNPPDGSLLIQTTTVISGLLDQTVNSDYSGPFRCMITRDVYDVTQEYILIPQGSRCSGSVVRSSGPNEIINNRMAMLLEWVVLPNGKRISFTKHAVMDRSGISALKDQVDYHFMEQFLGVAAYALLATGVDDNDTSSSFTGSQSYSGDVSQGLKDQVSPLVAKYLALVPTITLRSGKVPMRIFVEDDIYVKPWSKVNGSLLPSS